MCHMEEVISESYKWIPCEYSNLIHIYEVNVFEVYFSLNSMPWTLYHHLTVKMVKHVFSKVRIEDNWKFNHKGIWGEIVWLSCQCVYACSVKVLRCMVYQSLVVSYDHGCCHHSWGPYCWKDLHHCVSLCGQQSNVWNSLISENTQYNEFWLTRSE